MFPIERLQVTSRSQIVAGEIVYAAGKGLGEPRLVFLYEDKRHWLNLGGISSAPYVADKVQPFGGVLVAARNWRLEVDLESSITGGSGTPAPDDAVLLPGAAGFIGKMSYATVYVTADGAMLSGEPDWSACVAFRAWRVVIDLPTPGEVKVIAERGSA